MNDTYFNGNQATYDYDAERHVMCQEVGTATASVTRTSRAPI
jgi:hypothetical protein